MNISTSMHSFLHNGQSLITNHALIPSKFDNLIYSDTDYRDLSIYFFKYLEKQLHNIGIQKRITDERATAIYITPWLKTLVPFYYIVLALLLYVKGNRIIFIHDDLNLPHAENDEIEVIKSLIYRLNEAGFETINLSKCNRREMTINDIDECARMANLNAVWWMKTALPSSEKMHIEQNEKAAFLVCMPQILGFFQHWSNKLNQIIIPGGIFQNSGLALYAARKYSITAITTDSAEDRLFVGCNSVAAHKEAVKEALRIIMSTQSKDIPNIKKIAEEELKKCTSGTDRYGWQPKTSPSTSALNYDVLIPLNIDCDSAALGKHRLFHDTWEWLCTTINFLRETANVSVCIREHPPGTAQYVRRNDILCDALCDKFKEDVLVKVFRRDDKVNTYHLVRNSRLVLPFTSTVGLEAVLLGKPIVTMSDVYYAGLTFSPICKTVDEYFQTIIQNLQSYSQSKNIPDEAFVIYYLAQFCARMWTKFIPQRSQAEFCFHPINSLLSDPNIQALIQCLGGKNICLIQNERILSKEFKDIYNG
jgi:hypothetical protein